MSEKLKIDELLNELRKERNRLADEGRHPVFNIYMDYSFWLECRMELQGTITPISYEFMIENKIEGSSVWPVPSVANNGKRVTHPHFVIHCRGS